MKIKEQSTDEVMTNSQKFILDLGYTAQCSTKQAVVWHYIALRRQFDFTRHEVETRPGGGGGAVEDSSTAEKEDHARALNEIGPFECLITEEEWKAGLPEEVDSLVWKWVL
jgi:hypothetical protein